MKDNYDKICSENRQLMHCLPFSRARPAEYMVHVLIDYLSTEKIICDVLDQCTVYDMPAE